jgi:hypothetical protein
VTFRRDLVGRWLASWNALLQCLALVQLMQGWRVSFKIYMGVVNSPWILCTRHWSSYCSITLRCSPPHLHHPFCNRSPHSRVLPLPLLNPPPPPPPPPTILLPLIHGVPPVSSLKNGHPKNRKEEDASILAATERSIVDNLYWEDFYGRDKQIPTTQQTRSITQNYQ